MRRIGDYAFNECSSLASVNIPESATHFGDYVFSECSSLTSITLPESVTRIGEYAFYGCTSLTSIKIPKGVARIDGHAFGKCFSLASITVDNNNSDFCCVDGILYNIDQTKLFCCPGARAGSVSIPKSVTHIADGAFYGCSKLTSIISPRALRLLANSYSTNATISQA